MTRRPAVIVVAITLAATLTGCSGTDPNMQACTAFGFYLDAAGSPAAMDRATTVEQVEHELHQADDVDEPIRAGVDQLEDAVDASDQAWTSAADTMTTACTAYGWTGRSRASAAPPPP